AVFDDPDDRQHIRRRYFFERAGAPSGKEYAQVALGLPALPLVNQLVLDEVRGRGAKCVGLFALFGEPLTLFLFGGVDAFAQQLAPSPSLLAGLIQRQLAIQPE